MYGANIPNFITQNPKNLLSPMYGANGIGLVENH